MGATDYIKMYTRKVLGPNLLEKMYTWNVLGSIYICPHEVNHDNINNNIIIIIN